MRHLLSVAALLGERFESALLADVIGQDRGSVERELDNIYRAHRLIELAERSSRETAYTAYVRYRFSHSSYRDALLETFDTLAIERTRLANRAIDLLSVDAPADSPTFSARIAALLEAADRIPEAVQRYAESAKLSSAKFAHGAAAVLARRAIHLLAALPQDDFVRLSRMQLNTLLGMAVMSTSGFAALELEGIYKSLLDDALALKDVVGEIIGFYGLWVYSIDSGRLERSLDYANQALAKSIDAKDTAAEVEARYAKGTSLIQLGQFAQARSEFSSALENADSLGLRSHWFYQLDAAVSVRCQMARALWFLGDSEGAESLVRRAFEIAEERAHPESRAYALVFLADIAHLRRDMQAALELSAKAISAAVDCAASQELAWAQMIHAWALGHTDEEEAALIELEHSFAFYKQLNARVALTKFHCLAAELYLRCGKPEQALRQLDDAAKEVRETKEVYFESEVHRVRAEALLAAGTDARSQLARESMLRSYQVAAGLHSTPLQLRSALGILDNREAIGLSEEEARSRLEQVCSLIPAGNNDPEVRRARGIIISPVS
jgi:tetratricopeptide (TPR) repeat protein